MWLLLFVVLRVLCVRMQCVREFIFRTIHAHGFVQFCPFSWGLNILLSKHFLFHSYITCTLCVVTILSNLRMKWRGFQLSKICINSNWNNNFLINFFCYFRCSRQYNVQNLFQNICMPISTGDTLPFSYKGTSI